MRPIFTPRFAVILVVLILCLWTTLDLAGVGHVHSLKRVMRPAPYENKPIADTTFQTAISKLLEPIRQPLSEPYIDVNGKKWELEEPPVWTQPLGKNILILDMDTRIPNGENDLWNSATMNYEKLDPSKGGQLVSASSMNHYIYSQIHGYDYKFYAAKGMKHLYDTWIKPRVFHELLKEYQFVVFIDADATVQHLDLPLEWLFNKWKIGVNTSVAMPIDTEQVINGDRTVSWDTKGRVELNTGVMVAQNTPYSLEMMDVWSKCPDDKRYKGCSKWAHNWSHEQRAFSEYIRYDFNETGNIVEIPCDDAMGYPGLFENNEHVVSNCTGQFIRHHTLDKGLSKTSSHNALMQSMAELIQKALLKNRDHHWIPDNRFWFYENPAPFGIA